MIISYCYPLMTNNIYLTIARKLHMHIYTCAHMLASTHTCEHACAHIHIHTNTHTHTHTHIHTHATRMHTHIHARTQNTHTKSY